MAQTFTCHPLSTISRLQNNFAALSPSLHFQQRLVVASKFQIIVTVANNYELIAFRSTVIHEPGSDTANAQSKVTALDSQFEIVSIGLNADETFLGALAHNQHGCFVHIYDIQTLSVDVPREAATLCTIRVGNTASKGVAFEWNPALSDMFAASDNERTLSVAKIDMLNSSKYSILGEKKLEANINEISWSPKGKQLVVGDGNGKIYQLKPEIELVRATNAPENAVGLAVTNLSWLSTTEWLVAYANVQKSNGGTFILSIKKDKPPSWTPMNLSGQFSFGETRRLLVDWNVAILALPGTGQLLAICKPANASAWVAIPLATLPQPSPASFLSGLAIDLSKQSPVALGDGSTRRLPLVVTLNSDGSLRSFQLSPPSKDYPDCNVSLVPVDFTKIKHGLQPVELNDGQKTTTQAPSSVISHTQSTTPIAGLFTKIGEQKTSASPFSKSMPTGNLLGGSSATIQSSLNFVGATVASAFSAQSSGTTPTSTLAPTLTTLKPSLTPPSTNISTAFGKPIANATLPLQHNVMPEALSKFLGAAQPATPVASEKTGANSEETKAAVAAARASARESVEKFRKAWFDSHRDLHSFSINMRKSETAIDDAVSSLTHAENLETADEIQRMVAELDEELCDMLRLVIEKKEAIEEKTATYKESRDVELSFRRPLNLLERTQSDSVMQKFEDFTIRLHEAKKLIAETKKISTSSKPHRVSQFDPKFEGRLHESMKNIARYFAIVRARVDEIERKTLHLTNQKQLNSSSAADQSDSVVIDSTAYEESPSSVFITTAPKQIIFERGVSKSQQRAKMLEILSAKKGIKMTTKKVELLRIDCAASDDTLCSSFVNAPNLETSLNQKISSPLKVKNVLTMRNVSTQADAPPASASSLAQNPSDSSALSSMATTKQLISTAGDISRTGDDKKLSTTGIFPLATSTPGLKLEESSVKPISSMFPPSVASASAHIVSGGSLGSASKPLTDVNPLAGKSIFGGLQSVTKPAVFSGDSQSLLASTPKTSTTVTNEPKSLFGGMGITGSLCSDKKDEKKASSLFGTTNVTESDRKEEKKSSLFGNIGATTTSISTEKKDDKSSSLFDSKGSSESATPENKETKPTSLFGGAAQQTTPKSIFSGDPSSKTFSFTTQVTKASESAYEKERNDESGISKPLETKLPEVKSEKSLFSSTSPTAKTVTTTTTSTIFGTSSVTSSTPTSTATTTTSSSVFGAPPITSSAPTTTSSNIFGISSITSSAPTTITTTTTSSNIFGALKTNTSQPSVFGSVFGAKDAGTAQGGASAANTVTFSFKPKTPETAQPTTSFTFNPKPSGGSLGFAAAAAAAASSTDNDEGMDDDGVTSGTTQGSGSIFGGGFMSGIGSSTSANASKNVFGMGTSNLLKNSPAQNTTSLFNKGGQTSIFGTKPQSSSFASAAQQAAQSNTSPSSAISSSVFGAAPKFGGPPVFGGKPVFGSSPTQQTSAFGGASATGGGFSSFSGGKSLFGGATSGGSSLFGGGTSNQTQPKSSLFGGAQPSSSFSTWR